MKTNFIKVIVLSLVVLTISFNKSASAQSHDVAVATGNTYLLGEMNPASQMNNSYFVLPFFGNLGVNVSSPISVNKAIQTRADGNYLNTANVASALDKRALNVGVNMDIISFGIKLKHKQMITFSTKLRVEGDMMLPGQAVSFLTANSLTALNSYDLRLGSNVMGYGEAALGYSRTVWDNLTVGVRLKYLAGLAYAGSNSTAQLVLRDDATYDVGGDIDVRLMGIAMYKEGTNGKRLEDDYGIGLNNGFAVDFGAEYEFDFGLKLGLSVTDLGFIKWNQGKSTHLVSKDPGAMYHFIGVDDIGQYLEDGKDFQDGLDKLGDDMLETLNIDTLTNQLAFTSRLAPKLNIYGSYAIDQAKRHNVSLNMITRFNSTATLKNDFAATVGYTYCNKRDKFRALAAYTFSTRLGSKFSTGIVTEGRNGEFYFLLDATPVFGVYNARNVGMRIGGIFYMCKNRTNYGK